VPRITPIPFEQLVRVFLRAGLRIARTEGDHVVLTRQGTPRLLVIPQWTDVPVFIIRNNLRTAGMSREEYFRLLAEIR
jgi:hypothetical protein